MLSSRAFIAIRIMTEKPVDNSAKTKRENLASRLSVIYHKREALKFYAQRKRWLV